MGTVINFADIHVIESQAGGFANRTGWQLHESLTSLIVGSRHAEVRSIIRAHYSFVPSAADLFRLLLLIASEATRAHRSPLLHFETHGSEDGLHLASGEQVTWGELKPALTDINDRVRLNLVVLVAACIGLDLTKTVEVTDRAPVRLIIGPRCEVSGKAIIAATEAFYSTLLSSGNLTAAHKAMNESTAPAADRVFYAFSAELLFGATMRMYFEQSRDEGDLEARISSAYQRADARIQWDKSGDPTRDPRTSVCRYLLRRHRGTARPSHPRPHRQVRRSLWVG